MRWVKLGLLIAVILVAVYAVSMLFVDESKSFTIEKEINYPVEKVFPQFNNLQNFASWNTVFSERENLSAEFFAPYEGKGAAMMFTDRKNSDFAGEFFLRYENPLKTLRYHLFQGNNQYPYQIDVRFQPVNGKTKVTWFINTPKQPFLERSRNLISEDYFTDNIDRSMKNLFALLGNKVDRENMMANLKLDSLMIEDEPGQLLLGVNVSTKNSKNALLKNIVLNHNKVYNYVTMDLSKKSDEFGIPVLLTDPDNLKDKEVSYYYGIPLSKREAVSDNNFTFRTVNTSRNYVIFYQGNYSGHTRAVQQLLQKAKKDTMRYGQLQQIFIEEPQEDKDVLIKLSLPVFR